MIYVSYIITLLALSIYSYSQIDLNLTLSSNSLYQIIQKQLIYLGYFNRPLSTYIFLIIICLLFIVYCLLLYLTHKGKLKGNNIIKLVIISTLLLLFAYPAFSHDLFNYMFDARIVTKYHLNPYFYKALDFPGDLWIRFMHWTHRTYPYGPIWLLMSLPFSFLGFGKFVPTLLYFKLMFGLFHLGNTYLIYKILTKQKASNSLLGVVFYAFNPLILIESLISPHNEVMMLFFLLLSIYLIFEKHMASGLINLFVSIGVKFITIVYLPVYIYYWKFKITSRAMVKYFKIMFLIIFLPIIWEIIYREPYSWYFILPIGLGSFLANNKSVVILIIGVSLATLLRYAPYLYQGSYPPGVVSAQMHIFVGSLTFFIGLLVINWLRVRLKGR